MIFKIIAVITLISSLPAFSAAVLLHNPVHSPHEKQQFFLWFFIFFLIIDGILIYAVLERRAPVFGRIFWKGTPGLGRVALTFDDGPNEPFTSQILAILRDRGVPATFFVIGDNCRRFPDTVRNLAEEGHEIGNHTWTHEVLPLKSPAAIRDEISRTSALIEHCTGRRPALFRAPHGWRNPWVDRIARKYGCTPVAWTLGVWDTDRPGTDEIVRRTLRDIDDGCILLVHDGRGVEQEPDSSQLVEALPAIIDELKRRGFRFVTISEMMEPTSR